MKKCDENSRTIGNITRYTKLYQTEEPYDVIRQLNAINPQYLSFIEVREFCDLDMQFYDGIKYINVQEFIDSYPEISRRGHDVVYKVKLNYNNTKVDVRLIDNSDKIRIYSDNENVELEDLLKK